MGDSMSDNLDGTYAIVATSSTGCLAGVCVIHRGQLEGDDFEGGRYRGDVSLRDELIELNLTMEGPVVPSRVCDRKARQLLRLRETISATEWGGGSSIFLKGSGTWLIMRRISDAASVDHRQDVSRCAA
jgi:hypothetical protein